MTLNNFAKFNTSSNLLSYHYQYLMVIITGNYKIYTLLIIRNVLQLISAKNQPTFIDINVHLLPNTHIIIITN